MPIAAAVVMSSEIGQSDLTAALATVDPFRHAAPMGDDHLVADLDALGQIDGAALREHDTPNGSTPNGHLRDFNRDVVWSRHVVGSDHCLGISRISGRVK